MQDPDATRTPAAAEPPNQCRLTLAQWGREARVRFVLRGGVVAGDDKLRSNAQRSDTQSGIQLWSGSFEAG